MTSVLPVNGASFSPEVEEQITDEIKAPASSVELPKSSIEPAAPSSWPAWIPNPFASSKSKEPVRELCEEPISEIKKLWIDAYQVLAELEYEVMQLRARALAYETIDLVFYSNRELMQQLRMRRPDASKAQKHLAQMEQKLKDLRTLIEEGRVYFTKVLEIENRRYGKEFFERTIGRIALEGKIDNPDVVAFLKSCRIRQKELTSEIKKLKADLGACPLLLKA